MITHDLIIIMPELLLFVGAMGLLMFGVFTPAHNALMVSRGAIVLLIAAMLAVALQNGSELTAFNNGFVADSFTGFMKILTFGAVILSLIMSHNFMRQEKIERFEYPILALLAAVGMAIMISANDLIALYMGLELQSLALYVMASINRESGRATEAGLKYFVLGALSSGILLYGASLIYGFTGTVNFSELAQIAISSPDNIDIGLIFGLVFLIAGFAFKISAVPFHMWTPDVYEGAPTPVTGFFAAAPKVAAMALFMRAIIITFPQAVDAWQQIIIFLSIASMGLGAFAAIGQTNIKRLMAYSSIGHMGFALVGFAAIGTQGVTGVIIYITLYVIMTLGTFACILSMRNEQGMVEQIDELAGLSRTQPFMAFCLASLMFSLAGIPPLAGFFAKFYVFRAAIDSQLYMLALLGVLASVVAAYYYLRIVKIMYLDEPKDEANLPMPRELKIISAIASFMMILFFFYPIPLIEISQTAANALLSNLPPEFGISITR